MERVGTLSKTTKPIAFSNRPPNDSQNTIFYPRSPPEKKQKTSKQHPYILLSNWQPKKHNIIFHMRTFAICNNRIVWVKTPPCPQQFHLWQKVIPDILTYPLSPSTSHHLPGLWKFGDFKGGSDGLSDGPFLNGFLTFPSVLSSPFLK